MTLRDRFTGKEDQALDFAVPYLDFGARQYSPALRRWLVPDPQSEKYYGISPYSYCGGDPVNLVDPDGEEIYLLFYTIENSHGDGMLKAAAETRKYNIEHSDSFNSSEDIVMLREIMAVGLGVRDIM